MKKPTLLILFFIALLFFMSLACGSSGNVQVSQPNQDGETTISEPISEAIENPTEIPPVGTRRDNPAPVGSEVKADDMNFEVTSVIRPATAMIIDANMFNTEPETGQEYMLIEVAVSCDKDPTEKCNLSTYNFKILGSSGVAKDAEIFVVELEGLLENAEFYGGAKVQGYLPFIIDTDESDILLVYEPLIGDTFYLSIPEPSTP